MDRQLFGTSFVGDVLVVEVKQTVSSLADSSVLYEIEGVRRALKEGHVHAVVVDLALAAYFGSSMLEAIRSLWKEITAVKGRMALCNASEVGLEVLRVSKFDNIWPILDSREAAIKAVSKS